MNFERLRGDLLAIHQNVKGARTPFAAAIGANQRHRLVRRRFQFKTEPAVPRGSPPLAFEVAVDHPLALQVVVVLYVETIELNPLRNTLASPLLRTVTIHNEMGTRSATAGA